MNQSLRGQYGYFDEVAREYVITRPDTPLPWFNYIKSGDQAGWVGLISHTGGGPSYHRDPRHRRVLRYRYTGVPVDRPGRWIYIRDESSGAYWSAQYQPVCREYQEFESRVGLLRQTVRTVCEGIEAVTTYFAAPDDPVEIWWLRLTNRGRRARKLSTFSYCEFAVWGVMRDLVNIDNASACADVVYRDGAVIHRTMNDLGHSLSTMDFRPVYGWLASNRRPAGFDTDRDLFLGRWRDESRPLTVERGATNGTQGRGRFPLGCLHHRISLAPGASKDVIYQLGSEDDPRRRARLIGKYRKKSVVKRALQAVGQRWEDLLSRQQARTPDPRFDVVFNTWNPYQSSLTFHLSRSISPYEWGMRRGVGFRDTSQDAMAQSPFLPEEVEDKYLVLLANQYSDGTAQHNFFPNGPAAERESSFFDDYLWPVIGVCHLLRETGRRVFLRRSVKYRDVGRGSVLDHLLLALRAAWQRRGPHGLMRVGSADWNDSLNPGDERTESVFTSCLFCRAAEDLAEVLEHGGRSAEAARLRGQVRRVARVVNEIGWDGAWYRRLVFANGTCLGGRKNRRAGMIFLEPQVWAVLSGVAPPERARKCMDSVHRHLACEFGIRLVVPPFTEYDPRVGSVGVFAPGVKENGSVFNHTNPWAIIAETLIGRGERAYQYYLAMSPATKNQIADVHEANPYAFSQHVRVSPYRFPGMARNEWLTGTASWSLMALAEYILGIRPEVAGLRIDPCVPREWKHFEVQRTFRDVKLHIDVENPEGVNRGVSRLELEGGKVVDGNLLPARLLKSARRGRLKLRALMGRDGLEAAKRGR